MSTFVSVGNATQPFQRLLDAVAEIAARLPSPVVVQYGRGRFSVAGCEGRAFVPMDEFERLVAGAEVLILHAGAGSLIFALRAGKVPVVVPRRAQFSEHVDDHQVELAAAFAEAGRVVPVYDVGELWAAVARAQAMQREMRATARVPELVRRVGERLARYAGTLG